MSEGKNLLTRCYARLREPSIRDLACAVLAVATIMVWLLSVDFIEWLFKATRDHEHWELDEWIAILPGIALAGAWYSYRRWRESARLTNRLGQSLDELKSTTEELANSQAHAEHANRAKSEFLAMMSHEVRTPLNAIIGFSEVIKDESLGPDKAEYREYASNIHESGLHLLALVNDILDLSKVEFGDDTLNEEVIDIADIVSATMRLMQSRIAKDHIALTSDVRCDALLLRADARKLKQILANLLANAVKFSHPGGTVTLMVWCQRESGCVFQIVDQGIGIAAEEIPKAMSMFGQIHNGLNRRYEGAGLGLPLTKALVEQHGGTLDIQSQPEAGTTATVRLPAIRLVPRPKPYDLSA